MSETAFVSIVIPCLNEAKNIRDVLDSILSQDYPMDHINVLIADGLSQDGTRDIVREYSLRHPFIRMADNPTKSQSIAMNMGIEQAGGEIIIRMDAHATYPNNYVSSCVRALKEHDADIVGGMWNIVPQEDTLFGRGVALAIADRFGAGGAYYKTGPVTEPRYVDGVPYGAYRKTFIEEMGCYDERFHRSEDAELYNRVRAAGGKILLVPGIACDYRVRASLKSFCRHVFDNGFLVTYFLRLGKIAFYPRHLVPLVFVTTVLGSAVLAAFLPVFLWLLIASLGAYCLASLLTSLRIAVAQKNLRYVVVMPSVFALLHWSFGLGSLYGLFRALISGGIWRRVAAAGRR